MPENESQYVKEEKNIETEISITSSKVPKYTAELTSHEPEEIKLLYQANEVKVSKIETSKAEGGEDKSNKEQQTIAENNYHNMSLHALVDEFNSLLKNHKIQTLSKQVNVIKAEFNSKFNNLLKEKKEEFLADGGNEQDFYHTDENKKTFNLLCKTYKKEINSYYKERGENLKQNLENRLAIIEDIKNLINVEENISTTYKNFKQLQEKWRNCGPIPRDRYNNAWNTYHHHVERFYDFLHLNNDLRDMDFKHNYEQKLKIIEQAEALVKYDDVKKAFKALQGLHKLWKEELGPVATEYREIIWERFSNATKIIHDKRQEYFKDLDKAFEKNLEKKEKIISEIQKIANDTINSHGEWQKKSREVQTLREKFFKAGKVPLKSNEVTWTKFKESVKQFNHNKNLFYKALKKEQFENLQKKKKLIKIAEDNKDNNDFKTVTPLMKKIQNDWKKIGHVPRKDSDTVWNQFKNACNHYFDQLNQKQREQDQPLYEAFDKKNAILKELKAMTPLGEDIETSSTILKDKVAQWKNIGEVPYNKRFIEGKFYKAIDNAFSCLKIEKSKLEMIKFENKIETLVAIHNEKGLDNERHFIRKKIGDLKAEINQLENNLLFFSNVDDNNSLVKNVHNKISKLKQQLDNWKIKLSKIHNLI